MPVPTSITDCNATASNNSPAGSDSIGTSLDDYLRAHAAIIRQVSDDTLHLAGGTVTGQIKGITPVAAADLTRKDYVDTMLPKAGGTVTGQIKGITPVAAEDLTRKDYVDSVVSAVNTSSGTYTPTISGATNLTSLSVPEAFTYLKVGNSVTVSGVISQTTTSGSTASSFYITLPVASDFSSIYQGTGVACISNSGTRAVGEIKSDAATNGAFVFWYSPTTGSGSVYMHFTYKVI